MGTCYLLDLDGVVWLADEAIPGAATAVAKLRDAGARVAVFTNNSFPKRATSLDKLRRFGLETDDADLLTSAEAAAGCCEPGEHALVLGGPGIVEALEARQVQAQPITDDLEPAGPRAPSADVVVVGIDPQLSYRRLGVAVTAIRRGARLVGTNDDSTFPSPAGLLPGAGALLAAVRTASGAEPMTAGKPYEPAAELARRRLGEVAMVVGDRPSTDGLLARRLGARFGLVLSGVTPPGHGPLEVPADVEAEDLQALAQALLPTIT